MGVDIFYFADHDLPTDSAENFMKEFSKRVNGNVEVYDWNHDCEDCDKEFWQITEMSEEGTKVTEISHPDHSKFMKDDKWYVCYDSVENTFESNFPNPEGDINICFSNKYLDVELDLAKKSVMIWNLKHNWRDTVNCCRWYTMNEFFAEDEEYAEKWLQKMKDQIKEVLQPVFHCTKVLLVKDSSSSEHETLYGNYLLENGDDIETALKRNSEFEKPCTILRNSEAFNHDEEAVQPFYVFDLDNDSNS